MLSRQAGLGLLLASLMSASLAAATSADTPRVREAKAPLGVDSDARAALSQAVQRQLDAADLGKALRPYTVFPSLVQLRRYQEAPKRVKWVCVVDLALEDAGGNVLASVRGNAATYGSSARETLDQAASAAVSRLPEALQALSDSRKKPEKIAGR